MAGHKPAIPAKKPLPTGKKPKGFVKKPEKKTEAAEDNMKDHIDSKPVVKETPPAIKTDSAEEGTT